MTKIYRQGDVFLISTDRVKTTKKGKAVLALGEVSGHSHRIDNVLYSPNAQQLAECIEVPHQSSQLIHEEHDCQEIPKDKYVIRIQRRADIMGAIRKVMD